jgi:hypothetical protein
MREPTAGVSRHQWVAEKKADETPAGRVMLRDGK